MIAAANMKESEVSFISTKKKKVGYKKLGVF